MSEKFNPLDLSKLKFVVKRCDLCGSRESKPLYSVPFLGKEFCFVRCLSCGLVYQDPVLDKESLEHLYETLEYWSHKTKGPTDSTMLNYYSYLGEKDIRRRTAEIRVKWMAPHLSCNARILDLGCSDGLFVNALSQSGYRASGIDISDAMIALGRETYGVDVLRADFEGDWPFTKTFDAITCYATLSNIVNPSRVFANIRRHLRPGGMFFLNFGDSRRLVSLLLGSRLYLYRPTACSIYSKKIVKEYCSKYGFQILDLFNDIQVVPLARLIGFLRIPALVRGLKLFGLENKSLKMILLTGYAARVVREDV